MSKYINKDAIVAEIKTRIETYNKGYANGDDCRADALETFLHDIDTLEVNEVDLEKEIGKYLDANDIEFGHQIKLFDIAKYFFELGLKAQSKDMIEALRTEYEKGRADVIADTLSWLSNVWPQYCSNANIIDAYKEGVVKD